MIIRSLSPQDRPLLVQLLARIPSFDQADQKVALQFIDFSIADPKQQDYFFQVAVNGDDQPIGYACYGSTPLTEGTYDLYWIAVDPSHAGQGIGTQLMQAVEQDLRAHEGRLLIIETSSDDDYEQTRKFYLNRGFAEAERIKNFYRPGEDRVTYYKGL
jgi:ribosomal protein S18 acetylase RimI-like enzyme